jgi:XTP/dITP diphosphohydrolase
MSEPRLLTGKVVIATHNQGKLREMRELMAPYGIELVSAGELGLPPEPVEDGYMFAENAAIKAVAAAKASGLPALADDSGVCIDALDGAPRPVLGQLGRSGQGFRPGAGPGAG